MRWLDKYSRLREQFRIGRVRTEQKDILTSLKGKFAKEELPALVIEPGNETELSAALAYASEKQLRIAVASGLQPLSGRGFGGALLVQMNRMAAPAAVSADLETVRVDAGVSAEALAVDLNRAGRRWLPLWPVPANSSIGGMISSGWEGLRNWSGGGALAHIRSIDWMGFDGKKFSTGVAASGVHAPDLSGFLFGSCGAHGIVTSLELSLSEIPEQRTAALFELRDAHDAEKLYATLSEHESQPETVIYWGEVATDLIRRGNDGTVSDAAGVLMLAEWSLNIEWPMDWLKFGSPITDSKAIQALWQDVFRLPRTAARIYPGRVEARLRLPVSALDEIERIARELGRDCNIAISVWGTAECGWINIWALLPDEETRTRRRAADAVTKILQLATELGGATAPVPAGSMLAHRNGEPESARAIVQELRTMLKQRCDPGSVYSPIVLE